MLRQNIISRLLSKQQENEKKKKAFEIVTGTVKCIKYNGGG